MRTIRAAACGLALLLLQPDQRLWRHRNLGKAFYENPTTQSEAVEEFRKALELAPKSARERLNYGLALLRGGKTAEGIAELEKVQAQDPSIPHTWFNLGIAYKKAGQHARAIEQFERMIRLVPGEPVAHYNLGVLHKALRHPEAAIPYFESAARLDPNLAAPHFQLYGLYRQAGRAEEAARELATFQALKKQQEGAAIPEDMDWCYYAEVLEKIEPRKAASEPARIVFRDRVLPGALDAATAGLAILDAGADGRPGLLAWSASGVKLYRGGTDLVAETGLSSQRILAIAPGDFDNDGRLDLCVLSERGPELYLNRNNRFVKQPPPPAAGRFEAAVWVDYDHDYDLDLLLLGDKPALLRNTGAGAFEDRTADFPFVRGRAISGAAFRLVADSKAMDIAVTYAGRPGVIYRDRLGGKYEAVPAELPAGARALTPCDFDNDGEVDLLFRTDSGIVAALNRGARFENKPLGKARGTFAVADLENRGFADVITGGAVYRNLGLGAVAPTAAVAGGVHWAAADFDQDGRIDLAGVDPQGSVHVWSNLTRSGNRWLRVALTGIRNVKSAYGAEIEVKAGALYQKKQYTGAPVLFGLARESAADTVRITWPNGLIQNETQQAAGRTLVVEEAQRLSGSCPMIFTWTGRRFEFLTDVLGVAPLGAGAGGGRYFPVDHDEYVQIPADRLVPRGGKYEIRITEELSEVSYLDQAQLIALDHPAGVEVFNSDKFKSPPFPRFRLYGASRRVYPRRAIDTNGRDVLAALLGRDRTYPSGFRRDYGGVAEMHRLDLDFGSAAPQNRAVLILHGWVDWADGSTFVGASQGGRRGLVLPYLQVRDRQGRWRTVVEDMGIPAGKPKTIAVDLTGKFLSASREIRIVTNLCVYWDEAFLSEDSAEPPARLARIAPQTVRLHFRGFSRAIVDPRREQPEWFDYEHVSPVSMWNPTPGRYTRYGDVRELLVSADDRFVILGSGDELRLLFDAAALPAAPRGWRRDFLLLVDGWAKDRDPNTAFGQTVEPLPFHGMSRYPYPDSERFPNPAWLAGYNTRPALRLLPLLRPQGVRGLNARGAASGEVAR